MLAAVGDETGREVEGRKGDFRGGGERAGHCAGLICCCVGLDGLSRVVVE